MNYEPIKIASREISVEGANYSMSIWGQPFTSSEWQLSVQCDVPNWKFDPQTITLDITLDAKQCGFVMESRATGMLRELLPIATQLATGEISDVSEFNPDSVVLKERYNVIKAQCDSNNLFIAEQMKNLIAPADV